MVIAIPEWETLCESSACPQLAWVAPCGESAHCPEMAFHQEGVYIRDSARPDEVIFLDRAGWELLKTVEAPWEH